MTTTVTELGQDVLGTDEAQARADMQDVWHPEGVWATFVGR